MKKTRTAIVLLLCAVSLIISLVLFYHMGVFADEAGCSPADVCGGEGWLLADWLRLALLALACLLCGVSLFAGRKE